MNELNVLLGKSIKPIYGDRKPGDIKHSFADINLIKKNLNFEPIVNFVDGLKKIK